ncbi:MAG: transcriptional regulator [Escherichia coli]|nr:transcriptional regulator [Escherichia coli]
MRTCTQAVCFSNMENNEMNNTDTLEKIIRHQKNKDPVYPFREHLLMQLCIRANKRMQDNISEFLGAYGIKDRRAKKISLTSEGMFFIQRLTLAQSMYLKEIWGYLTHDEQELFEVINKKLLAHLDDVSS